MAMLKPAFVGQDHPMETAITMVIDPATNNFSISGAMKRSHRL
jgi:hypothetical protein